MDLFEKADSRTNLRVAETFDATAAACIVTSDTLEWCKSMPDETFQLIISSPPYNIGKEYERKVKLEHYLERQVPKQNLTTPTLYCLTFSLAWEIAYTK
jgi:adenine-specific DNA-methyltransferase